MVISEICADFIFYLFIYCNLFITISWPKVIQKLDKILYNKCTIVSVLSIFLQRVTNDQWNVCLRWQDYVMSLTFFKVLITSHFEHFVCDWRLIIIFSISIPSFSSLIVFMIRLMTVVFLDIPCFFCLHTHLPGYLLHSSQSITNKLWSVTDPPPLTVC